MAENQDPKHVDKRTAERYLKMGVLEEKAYERYLKGLPDVADKAVPVETSIMDEDFDDDFEEDEDEGEEQPPQMALPEEPPGGQGA